MSVIKKYYLLFFICLGANQTFAQTTDLRLAEQFYKNGEMQKALEMYVQIFQSGNEKAYEGYINTLLQLKKYPEAYKVVKKMTKKYPKNLQYSIDKGRISIAEGKESEGFEVYDELIENLNPDPNNIFQLAQLFAQIKTENYVIKTLQQGRKLLKNQEIFFEEIVEAYVRTKDIPNLALELVDFFITHPQSIAFVQNKIEIVCKESKDYEIVSNQLLKMIQKHPQNIQLVELLIWVMMQKRAYNMALIQIIALDKRLNESGQRVYETANTFLSNQAYDEAIKAYNYLVTKGQGSLFYVSARMGLLDARNKKIDRGLGTQEDFLALEKDYQQLLDEFGKGNHTLPAIRNLAHLQAYRLNKLDESEALLEELIAMQLLNPQMLNEIKLELGDIYILNEEPWEAALLYGQVEKSAKDNPLGQEAMFKNAKLAFYNGDFAWAKSQLDVLKGGTSQLIANDALDLSALLSEILTEQDSTNNRVLTLYAQAELNTFKTRYPKALLYLDSLEKEFPANSLVDDDLMCRAKIYLAQNQWQLASNTLGKIIQDYYYDTLADDAIFMLADLQETHLQDKDQAKYNYQRLLTDFPASVWTVSARKRYRLLRGDVINEGD